MLKFRVNLAKVGPTIHNQVIVIRVNKNVSWCLTSTSNYQILKCLSRSLLSNVFVWKKVYLVCGARHTCSSDLYKCAPIEVPLFSVGFIFISGLMQWETVLFSACKKIATVISWNIPFRGCFLWMGHLL